ncbi:unnamed protein product [Rodentolepis nana]|uniref:Endo/exonuclease/phosphatase domain-containing protein n=1 Tax=Rodentolepis nana TaxID=102285 RepID=A0A0R3TNN7_RODNA|nr:unnamed protein product [Rodentolepis nana]
MRNNQVKGVWKCQNHFKIYEVYNPPQNKPNFDLLNISHKTVPLGDTSAHYTRWGYRDIYIAEKEIKDTFNSNPLEIIYSSVVPDTYLHYNATRKTPDLLLASTDISELTRHKIIADPGSGHKPVIACITIGSKRMALKMPTKLLWNFNKANWP